MGICCSRHECIILENNLNSDKNIEINNSKKNPIIEVISHNQKIIYETRTSNDDNNDNNLINDNIGDDTPSKFTNGPIFRLLKKKNLDKIGDSVQDEVNGNTNITKI